MKEASCHFCSKTFFRKQSQLAISKRHFCSPKCQYEARKTGKLITCFICGKCVYKKKKDILYSKSGKYFCGQRCSNKWLGSQRLAERHPNWVSGEFAYKEILSRQSPHKKCLLCGYKNKEAIIVHHVDQNRKNNKVENLVWLCRNCHHLVHNYTEPYKRLMRKINPHGKESV